MALILDHVNGVGDDNRLENLRIACPNCAATFDTHCGRKNLRARSTRKCALCGAKFSADQAKQRYCSQTCGSRSSHAHRGVPIPERRKVERPPLAQLEQEIAALGYVGVGRKYGVSDNAVRKWVLGYQRQEEVEADRAA
jgi:hypothetical protein